ncbi:MAG: hypothetical protein ACU0A5_14900 [Salipiger marinus]|uniref:hypothetical protein n=1 Tax=Salipiger marinus TaxID=555512 RepID=UPI004058281B
MSRSAFEAIFAETDIVIGQTQGLSAALQSIFEDSEGLGGEDFAPLHALLSVIREKLDQIEAMRLQEWQAIKGEASA